jgi:hypothetical protein
MRENFQNPRDLNRTQPQDGSKSKTSIEDLSKLNTNRGQAACSTGKVTEEAIEVLSFMGFRL